MNQEVLVERLFETLVNGDRAAARSIVEETFDQNAPADRVLTGLMWPAYEMIERLHRSDQLSAMGYHFATRLLRTLVDQTAARLRFAPRTGKTLVAFCGPSQSEELAAQIAADLAEAKGYTVHFAGGGVPGDEILARVQETQPDILLLFASAAPDLPDIRRVIDDLRTIGASAKTQIVVGGGVFNRADGLAEEIGIDLCAADPLELVEILTDDSLLRASAAPAKPAAAKRKARAA